MAILDELRHVYDIYRSAYRRRDAAGCAAVFTLDTALYSPFAPPALGRKALESPHKVWVELEGSAEKQLDVFDAGVSGDASWCLTRYSDSHEKGTSLNVFERQPDGSWLIRVCSLNEG